MPMLPLHCPRKYEKNPEGLFVFFFELWEENIKLEFHIGISLISQKHLSLFFISFYTPQ